MTRRNRPISEGKICLNFGVKLLEGGGLVSEKDG